ncbi:MAG TPA: protein kinase [Terriglobales bacterium]|jgi:serine/threonine protein kinase/Tfp pilus assembly protein PilF|nr:protein kinase [Terriglobales bacterium]
MLDSKSLLGRTLSHYKIVEKIGDGGMGVVYKAHDTRLRRFVALKFLPDDVSADPQALSRFQHEARAASALNHINICAIYDIVEQDLKTFIVLEFLEGRTLKGRISAESIPVGEILDFAFQVADALHAAHSKGIIHRDITCANIFVTTEGQAKVLDFGLAKISERSESDAVTGTIAQTEFGVVMGTLPYMSPEQVQGRSVDQRTDIFSFGVVFYELSTRERPFHGATSADLISSILRDSPKPATELRSDLPIALESILERCLAKDVANRYQFMKEVRDELNLLRSNVGSTFLKGDRAAQNSHQSIAVLPFVNMSSDPENDFFADGITEEIGNALGHIKDLYVAARMSSFSFKGKQVDLRDIGEKLNVKMILEGSIRQAGNRLRIVAQLINCADGFRLWSERYDRETKDVFEIQDEIASAVADRLTTILEGNPVRPLVQAGTKDLGAYQLYVKGRALLYQRGQAIPLALECCKKAVALDPRYAQAWSCLADAFNLLGLYGFLRPEDCFPHAKAAAMRAVALDPSLAEAHGALALVAMLWDWDWPQAESAYLRALQLNPRYVQARTGYGLFYLQWVAGRFEEGIIQARHAVDTDPFSGYAMSVLAMTYLSVDRFAEAKELAHRAVELDHGAYFPRAVLQGALGLLGHFEESIAVGQSVLAMSGRHTWSMVTAALTYAYWGKTSDAKAIHRELLARAAREYVQPAILAASASAAGEADEAIVHAQEAYATRDCCLIFGKHWSFGGILRRDPRFVAILDDLRLPHETTNPSSKTTAAIAPTNYRHI